MVFCIQETVISKLTVSFSRAIHHKEIHMSILSALFGTKKLSDNIVLLDPSAFSKAIADKEIQLVDVRTPNEYQGGHIGNAINIDFFNPVKFEKSFATLNKEMPLYIYCRSGSRSKKAAKKLLNMGFSKIFDLKGGYLLWR